MNFIYIFIKVLCLGYLCIFALVLILSVYFLSIDIINGSPIVLTAYINSALSNGMNKIYTYVVPLGAFITSLFIYLNIKR